MFDAKNSLYWLNGNSNVGIRQDAAISELLNTFKGKHLTALEIGSPYGGAIEFMARKMGKNGTAYGYDTFEGHPKDLADDPMSMEAICMDYWYQDDVIGKYGLSYEYQTKALARLELPNTKLVKGRINEHSFDDIKKIHFAMIDLDLIKPTEVAYNAIKDKVVKGGYLFFHDSTSPTHLPAIYDFVTNRVIPEGIWGVELVEDGMLTILKKK